MSGFRTYDDWKTTDTNREGTEVNFCMECGKEIEAECFFCIECYERETKKGESVKISDAFPSEFLKATDLQGKRHKVTISRVEMRQLGEDKKPCVFFVGKDKGLALNKTNAATIADAYGDESDDWDGKAIIIYPTKVDYRGERVDAIRIDVPEPPKRKAKPVEEEPPEDNDAPPPDDDDDIPF